MSRGLLDQAALIEINLENVQFCFLSMYLIHSVNVFTIGQCKTDTKYYRDFTVKQKFEKRLGILVWNNKRSEKCKRPVVWKYFARSFKKI